MESQETQTMHRNQNIPVEFVKQVDFNFFSISPLSVCDSFNFSFLFFLSLKINILTAYSMQFSLYIDFNSETK